MYTPPGGRLALNAAALLKGSDSNRFLSDPMLRTLLERDGVVGLVPYNNFLLWGWRPGDGRPLVTLSTWLTRSITSASWLETPAMPAWAATSTAVSACSLPR
jgi:microsomal dipeptidase-like Zn-dependent dipeptidase